MYAIIENGGKQYKAFEGESIEIDLLPDEVGKKKTFDKILLLSTEEKTEVGDPFLKHVSVDGTILSHFKGPKIVVFKYRAKQRYRVKTGHRQKYTRVQIDSIVFPGKAAEVKKNEETQKEEKAVSAKKSAPTITTNKKTKNKVKSTSTTAKKQAAKKTTAAKQPEKAAKSAASVESKAKVKSSTSAKKPAVKKATTAKKPAAKKTTTSKKPAESKKTSADKK